MFNPFTFLRDFLFPSPPSRELPWESFQDKMRFSFPAGLVEGWKVVEINLDAFMAHARQHDGVININKPEGYSGAKIRKICERLGMNEGMVHMPEIFTNGAVFDGMHRMAVLERIGMKVIPVLIPKEADPEPFLQKFGVDRKYYKEPVKGQYFLVDREHKPDPVDVFEPVDRKAVLTPPGPYAGPHGSGAGAFAAPPPGVSPTVSRNVERLKGDGSGRDLGPRSSSPKPEGPPEVK